MGASFLWIFLCFVSMQLSTVYNSYHQLTNGRLDWVDPIFFVSLGISLFFFLFGFIFQFVKFRKYRKSKIFDYSDKNKMSIFKKLSLSLTSRKESSLERNPEKENKGNKLSSLNLDEDMYVSELDRRVLEDLLMNQDD